MRVAKNLKNHRHLRWEVKNFVELCRVSLVESKRDDAAAYFTTLDFLKGLAYLLEFYVARDHMV